MSIADDRLELAKNNPSHSKEEWLKFGAVLIEVVGDVVCFVYGDCSSTTIQRKTASRMSN